MGTVLSLVGFVGIANAYSVSGSTGASAPAAVNLPQIPAGTFNLNWTNFFNNLPIENFINSLKATGNGAVSNSIQATTPAITTGVGQSILQQIDNWTSTNLGFRFSALFGAVLGVLSWALGLAKTVVDWLLSLIH